MGSTADNPREDEELPEQGREGGPERVPPERVPPERVPPEQRPQRRESDRRHLDTTAVAGPTFAQAERAVTDLSEELMATLPRDAGQIVRCRRISGDRYRVNWWGSRNATRHDNAGAGGLMVTRYRVVKSRMLRATTSEHGIAIDADEGQ